MEEKTTQTVTKEELWNIDNYIVLRDYYDRTISRIAARCVRLGNIAIEEYPHYPYILDVLEEICETGNYLLTEKKLHPYIEKKIAGGVKALEKNLALYQEELQNNASPDMIKQDPSEISKMKEALGGFDPTEGAGMQIDDLMDKLLKENNVQTSEFSQPDQDGAKNNE